MINDEELRIAIHATIAKQILEGLDSKYRDAILQESITKALKDYRFSSEINTVVAEKGAKVVRELIERKDRTNQITETIEAGFADYLIELRKAVPKILKEGMHGDSYSERMALILKCWPKEA